MKQRTLFTIGSTLVLITAAWTAVGAVAGAASDHVKYTQLRSPDQTGVQRQQQYQLQQQQQQESRDPYQQAQQFFMEGRYSRAAEILEAALGMGGLGAHRASAWILLCACRLGSDAPEPALQALDGLDREYPDGPYLLEREWLRGRAHARAGRYYEAALVYAGVFEREPQSRLAEAARDELAMLVAERLDAGELRRLGYEWAGTDLKGWLAVVAIRELADRGDLARARRLLERIEAEAPEEGYGRDTEGPLAELSERLKSAGPAGFVLGVLAPLTGPDAEIGREIVDAVRLALATAHVDAQLAVRNTRGTYEGTLKGTLSLIRDEGAQLLLGPVVEELALIAAGLAEGMGIPIILPYTHSAVAPTVGDNVYQLQATPRIQAQALADAAIDSLGMLTFAVLNPLTGSGPDFAEAFIARVEEKGGNVIAHQEYFPETSDYQTQLEAIRRAALILSLADTSEILVTDNFAIQEANLDTLGDPVPVGSLDALVVPATDPMDAAQIALQTNFVYLVTTILGGSAWNSYEVIRSGGYYVNGVVFTDAYSIGWTSMQQIDFANQFHSAYLRQPSRTATFAYDAAKLALAAWQMAPPGTAGTDRRQAMRRWLLGVSSFEGASGPINFSRNAGINDNVFLLRIQQDTIVPLIVTPATAVPPQRP
ncbi:MAG: ABC transporter substrate-binding protein [Candidatus Latescibacteria bacterium]|nr:ABC transporter substrate-binding protein [Candidatus Latescibacterota bacterium]